MTRRRSAPASRRTRGRKRCWRSQASGRGRCGCARRPCRTTSVVERKRVVLVRDDPAACLLPKAERQSQPLLGVLRELLRLSTAKKRVRIRHLGAGGYLELDDLERGAARLPLEERRPGVAVRLDSAHAVLRRRHVEHDDVVRVSSEDALHVTGVHGDRPALDQASDLLSLFVHYLTRLLDGQELIEAGY